MVRYHRYPAPAIVLGIFSALFLLLGLFIVGAQPPQGPCPGFVPILGVGDTGVVGPGPSNNVRARPTLSGTEISEMPPGTQFAVLDGPVCADGYTWWYVDDSRVPGWTATGTPDDYFLDLLVSAEEIVTVEAGQQPTAPAVVGQEGQTNVAFILDASGSMQAFLPDGERRITVARRALGQLSSELPETVNASLWTFGHRIGNSEAERPQSCEDIEQLVPLGPANPQQFQSAANGVIARGWTPLTSTIEQSANTLPPASDNSIVIISDGEETCGGDPCAVAEALHNSNIELVVNTIGFDVDAATREQLQCIARVTDGQYYDAANADELSLALQQASAPNATVQVVTPDGRGIEIQWTLTDNATGEVVARGPAPASVPAGAYTIDVQGYTPQVLNVESGQTVNITLEGIPPTATPFQPTPQAADASYTVVDSNGARRNDVTIEVENAATLTDFSGQGTVTVPPGEYRGRITVPLADGVTQSISLADTGLTQIAANEELFINIDNYFGDPVTFRVADGAGNILPDAQIDLFGQFCIGESFATFTGEAVRFRTRSGSQRLCLTVTANGESFRPYVVNNLDVNALEADTQTLTVYDGLTFRTAGMQPPGIGRVQAVAPSGEPYPDGRSPFIIPTNLNDVTWWRGPNSSRGTLFYTVPGEIDISLGSTARSYLAMVTVEGGQVTPVVVAQDDNGNYFAPEGTQTAEDDDATDNSPTGSDVIFFDDFEQAGVEDLQRNYAGWANWDVVAGSVDAINAVRARNVDDSYGVIMDLDGSNRMSAIVTTKDTFTLQPGEYTFSFEASSSRGGDGDNTFRVVVGGFVDETVTASTSQPMLPYTYSFTVNNPTDVQITFDHTLTLGDNEGAYIDNVRLAQG